MAPLCNGDLESADSIERLPSSFKRISACIPMYLDLSPYAVCSFFICVYVLMSVRAQVLLCVCMWAPVCVKSVSSFNLSSHNFVYHRVYHMRTDGNLQSRNSVWFVTIDTFDVDKLNIQKYVDTHMSGFGYFSHTCCWQVYKINDTQPCNLHRQTLAVEWP